MTAPIIYGLAATVEQPQLSAAIEAVAPLAAQLAPAQELQAAVATQASLAAQLAPVLALKAVIAPLAGQTEDGEDPLPSTVEYRVIIGSDLLAADPDAHNIAVTPVSDHTAWRIMHAKVIVLPAGAVAEKLDASLLWDPVMANPGHSGVTKWAISRQGESPGQVPNEIIDLTPEFPATNTPTPQLGASGTCPQAALGIGSFTIMLLGKADASGQQITATVSDESQVIVTIR